jgi:hypothetical protein
LEEYEYREYPEVDGIKRVSTDRLVLIQINKDEAIKRITAELHGASFGGLYFLIDSSGFRIYIGESSDVRDRIGQHIRSPPLAGSTSTR